MNREQMADVGTANLPEDTCGFSDSPDAPICGQRSVLRGRILGTWEGESTVTACVEHSPALVFVADEVWPLDGVAT